MPSAGPRHGSHGAPHSGRRGPGLHARPALLSGGGAQSSSRRLDGRRLLELDEHRMGRGFADVSARVLLSIKPTGLEGRESELHLTITTMSAGRYGAGIFILVSTLGQSTHYWLGLVGEQ